MVTCQSERNVLHACPLTNSRRLSRTGTEVEYNHVRVHDQYTYGVPFDERNPDPSDGRECYRLLPDPELLSLDKPTTKENDDGDNKRMSSVKRATHRSEGGCRRRAHL